MLPDAVALVSPDTRGRMPDVPWAAIVAMRNRLVHTYFDIDLDIVWATIQVDLPSLLQALETAPKRE